ncbi:uncharacterized protein LOC121430261 [Lytechinus variegatus]|nr:uncharacterized protein LOC121430261 [Lytechinus variegatus]
MVSFDVVSLFTNVPVEAACDVALQRLEADASLPDRTDLSPTQVTELLRFVLKSTYFMYDGRFYEQQEGAAMGSPVSAVIANLYMESFEEDALHACPPEFSPRIWKRYVDDTFIVTDRSTTDCLLNYVNAQQPSIRFTMEREDNNRIAFLDTLVHRDDEGRLTTTVYRKPTHTDQYLAYDSHHPQSVKRGVVKCLYDRASRIVSKPQCTAAEKQRIASALVSNGYPRSFLNRVTKRKNVAEEDIVRCKSTVVLPFVDSISRQLRRHLEKYSIRAVFKSDTTIRKQLVRPKDPALPGRLDGVVYKIPCGACDKVYIGETGRPVNERMLEHRRDVKHRRIDSSAVAEHAWNADHPPNWDEVSCIARDKHWYTRRVKEAIQIRLHPNNVNRDNGIDIPEEWLPTIRRHAPPTTARSSPVDRPPTSASNPISFCTATAVHSSTSANCPLSTPTAADGFSPTSASPTAIAPSAASDWSVAPTNHTTAVPAPTARSLRYKRRAQRVSTSLPDED